MQQNTDSPSHLLLSRCFRSSPARLGLAAFALFLVVSLISRIALLIKDPGCFDANLSLIASLLTGFGFDAAAGLFAALPWVLLGAVLPSGFSGSRAMRLALNLTMSAYAAALVLIAVAEWFFWDEFGARFNFIAVDYLVFTNEVLGNITESYPLGLISAGIAGAAGLALWLASRLRVSRWISASRTTIFERIAWPVGTVAACAAAALLVNQSSIPAFSNQFTAELAKNGCWSFFSALRRMDLDYGRWYATHPTATALANAKALLETPEAPAASSAPDNLRRRITAPGDEHRWNVMFICMESMSLDFTGLAGTQSGLTPNLDRIAHQSVFFGNLHATGTRTVRGMEAITLGLPPTPGQSIIYRPGGTGLWTYFVPFNDRGYDCAFLYGGDGRFDFMNRYFSTSGCRIMDAPCWDKQDTTFKTAWGACDEDLFRKAIREADADHAAGRPFHFFCMTTSNHRPFDFPAGRIDLPSHGGRAAAVKYSDWAVGRLLDEARAKPWFSNTLFVFCSDHCASSAGKAELDVTKYHIPAMIYNPDLVAPRTITALSSQIDVMPTVLGLLGWGYETRGFGHDLLAGSSTTRPGRAFVSNYQKIALLKDGRIAILKPNRQTAAYTCDSETGALGPLSGPASGTLLDEAVTFYQSASWIFESGRLKRSPPEPAGLKIAFRQTPGTATSQAPTATTSDLPPP